VRLQLNNLATQCYTLPVDISRGRQAFSLFYALCDCSTRALCIFTRSDIIHLFKMAESSSLLPALSTELLLQIFSHLDPVHSTCLGLACRRLYHVYSLKHKKIPLDAFTYDCPIPSSNLSTMCYLFHHLEDWKPAHLMHCWRCHKFGESDSFTQTGPLFGKCIACVQHEHNHSQSSSWQFSVHTRQLAFQPPVG
jgi:hypothetical protein